MSTLTQQLHLRLVEESRSYTRYQSHAMSVTLVCPNSETLSVPREICEQWYWFSPILSSNFKQEEQHTIPLNVEDLRTWYELAKQSITPETRREVTCWPNSEVEHLLQFFGPKNDNWRCYVIPDQESLEARVEAYYSLGRHIRSIGSCWPWVSKTSTPAIHDNFSLHYDPVYSTGVYAGELTPQERISLIDLRNTCLLTGIVHSGWLRTDRSKLLDQEIPWDCIAWEDMEVIKCPNILTRLRTPGVLTASQAADMLAMAEEEHCKLIYTRPTYVQHMLMYPDRTAEKEELAILLGCPNPEAFPSIWCNGKDRLMTNVSKPASFYAVVVKRLVLELKHNAEKRTLGKLFKLLDPFIPICYTLEELEDPLTLHYPTATKDQREDHYRLVLHKLGVRSPNDDGGIYDFFTTVTSALLHRGESRRVSILEEDYLSIVKYGLETVGSDALRALGSLLVLLYLEFKQENLLKLASVLHSAVPTDGIILPSRLP